jgi:hypothetical protein
MSEGSDNRRSVNANSLCWADAVFCRREIKFVLILPSHGGKGFFLLPSVSRPALRPTQAPIQWVPRVLSPGVERDRGVTLTTHPHLVPRSRISSSFTTSPSCRLLGSSGTALLLPSMTRSSNWSLPFMFFDELSEDIYLLHESYMPRSLWFHNYVLESVQSSKTYSESGDFNIAFALSVFFILYTVHFWMRRRVRWFCTASRLSVGFGRGRGAQPSSGRSTSFAARLVEWVWQRKSLTASSGPLWISVFRRFLEPCLMTVKFVGNLFPFSKASQ